MDLDLDVDLDAILDSVEVSELPMPPVPTRQRSEIPCSNPKMEKIDLSDIPQWTAPSFFSDQEAQLPLKAAALNGLTLGESIGQHRVAVGFTAGAQPAEDLEWKKTLIEICDSIDRRETCRFIFQDTAAGKEASRAILIDILGPPLIPPFSDISHCRQDESSTSPVFGPIIPCRFVVTNGSGDPAFLPTLQIIQEGMNDTTIVNDMGIRMYPPAEISTDKQELGK